MIPPIFSILNQSAAVTAILGSNPLRVYPWGDVPEKSAKPYASYTAYNGNPENTLDGVPLIDNIGTQIDVCATTAHSCQVSAEALRDALEPHAHMLSFGNMERDERTRLYTLRLEFDFWTGR